MAAIGFAGIHLQSDNIDQNLINQGFGAGGGDKIVYNEEINPSWGGPILRDRLWFFASARWTKRYTAVAGKPVTSAPTTSEPTANGSVCRHPPALAAGAGGSTGSSRSAVASSK